MLSEEEIKQLNEQLFEACQNQDLGKTKELIANGAQANYVKKSEGTWGAYDKESILHSAICSLQKDNEDPDQETWKEIIMVLLKNGANPNEKKESYDWRGCGTCQTAFDLLKYNIETPDPDLMRAFIKAGLDPNLARVQDIQSMRTYGCIKSNLLHDFTSSRDVECVIALLQAGADIDIRAIEDINNERGYREEKSETALHLAVLNDDIEICIILLAKGADIDSRHHFIDSKEIEKIKKENTTDDPRHPAYKNPWENIHVECTALHLALKNNNYHLAKFLLAAGANHEVSYKSGNDRISSLNLFLSGDKTIINKEEALKNSLTGKMSLESLIKSMAPSFATEILSSLTKVQDLSWEMDKCNFDEIFESLKSLY